MDIKTIKAAIVKELARLEVKKQSGKLTLVHAIAQDSLKDLANELGIEILPEDYKA